MTSFQRVIKYIGIGLAIFLIVGIIVGISAAIFGFNLYRSETSITNEIVTESSDCDYILEEFTSMEIESGVADIVIETGDGYRVETHDVPDTIDVTVRNNKLIISNKNDFHWFDNSSWNKASKIYITVPEGYVGEKIDINLGAGDATISDLSVKKFILDGGVGDLNGNNLKIGDVRIDAGVGDIEFDAVEFGKVDVDSGVGNVTINGKIIDDCDFDGGVGNIELEIEGTRENFNLDVDSGVGGVFVNGRKTDELKENKKGRPTLEIDGGVGSISVDFTED